MDTSPFNIYYIHHHVLATAEIHPCCREDNVVDYAVWKEGRLAFTIARDIENKERWAVALKNADDEIEDELVQLIGTEIEKRSDIKS